MPDHLLGYCAVSEACVVALITAAAVWRVHNDDDLFWASVNIVPGVAVNQDCLEIESEYAHDGDVRRTAAADVWPSAGGDSIVDCALAQMRHGQHWPCHIVRRGCAESAAM